MNGAIREKGGQMRVPRHARCYSEPRCTLRGGIIKEKKINTSNESNWNWKERKEKPIDQPIEKKRKKIRRIGRKFERIRITYRKLLLEKILSSRSVEARVTRLTFEWKYPTCEKFVLYVNTIKSSVLYS